MTDTILLILDSSTIRASVAISRGFEILYEVFVVRQKSHSEQMHIAVDEVLKETNLKFGDINAIAVTQGPGSFTGLRVAGNMAKTYSFIFNIPLIGINTLEALAQQSVQKDFGDGKPKKICAMINAYKRMVFLALYEKGNNGELTEKIGASLYTIEQLDLLIAEQVECIGDAFDYYKEELSLTLVEHLKRTSESKDYPLPKSILDIALIKLKSNQTIVWNHFTPLYLKASEAEENLRKGLLQFRKLD